MKQHKWHKEIKAWADGAKIEVKHIAENEWENFEGDWSLTEGYEFRIKSHLKEPQYLYVHKMEGAYVIAEKDKTIPEGCHYMGKIRLEAEG